MVDSSLIENDNVGLDKKTIESLMCIICRKICIYPRMIKCCDNIMCKICIEPWLLKNNSCPICRHKCPVLEAPNKFIMRLFDNVIVECPNKDNGCKDKIVYGNLSAHINLCIFKNKINSCDKCKDEVIKLMKKIDNLETQIAHLNNTLEFNKKCSLETEINSSILEKIKFSLNIHNHFLFPINRSNFSCNGGCEKTFKENKKVFYCSECDCDICEICFDNTFKKSKDRKEKHIHSLKPVYIVTQRYRCDSCTKSYDGQYTSFRCDICDFDLCWKCYWP